MNTSPFLVQSKSNADITANVLPVDIDIEDAAASPFLIQQKNNVDNNSTENNFIEITPMYAFTVKTTVTTDDTVDKAKKLELDINICTHDGISTPHMVTKLDNDGKPVEGLNAPVSIG